MKEESERLHKASKDLIEENRRIMLEDAEASLQQLSIDT